MQLSPQKAASSTMNSPNRTHPALPTDASNMVAFPTPGGKQGPSRLEQLLTLEAAIREQPSAAALALHSVNEPLALLGFEQAFFLRFNGRGRARVEAVSSVADPDRTSQLLRAVAVAVSSFAEPDHPRIGRVLLPADQRYPFSNALWLPMNGRDGRLFAGLLALRGKDWTEGDLIVGKRLAGTYSHALQALTPPSLLRHITIPRWLKLAAPSAVLAALLVPVPLTTLAPFEVIPDNPGIVSAPIDGVISEILVDPNARVSRGQPLFRFDGTALRAEADVAAQRVVVAATRLATAQQGAFSDLEAKRSLAIVEKELVLAQAESAYADDMLAKVTVTAPEDGVAIFTAKSDWTGRPVHTGEKVMEVADPARIAYRADLAVHDSVALEPGATVRLFLDSDPLSPRRGKVRELSYHASQLPGGQLAYRVLAIAEEGTLADRIGLRGTAQISGRTVSLGFFLFRRPLAALRQYFGV